MASMSAAIAHSRKKGWIRNPLGEVEPQITDAMLLHKPASTATVHYSVELPTAPAQVSMAAAAGVAAAGVAAAEDELVPGVIRKSMTPDFIRKSITPVPDYKSPAAFPCLASQPAPAKAPAAWPKDDLLHEYVQYRAPEIRAPEDVVHVRAEIAPAVAEVPVEQAPTACNDLEAQYAAPRLEDAAFVPSSGSGVLPPKPRGWFAWLF